MLPELLRFSSRSRLLEMIPEEIKSVHRTRGNIQHTHNKEPDSLMEGWVRAKEIGFDCEAFEDGDADKDAEIDDDGFDDNDLTALGL